MWSDNNQPAGRCNLSLTRRLNWAGRLCASMEPEASSDGSQAALQQLLGSFGSLEGLDVQRTLVLACALDGDQLQGQAAADKRLVTKM